MFYSPLTLPVALALSLSALLSPWGSSGTFPRVLSLPSFLLTGYKEIHGAHVDCVCLIFGVPDCVSTSLSWQQ